MNENNSKTHTHNSMATVIIGGFVLMSGIAIGLGVLDFKTILVISITSIGIILMCG